MRYFLNRFFQRSMKFCDFSYTGVHETIKDIYLERGISLGQHLYKIRSAAEGHGKSGGFRVIFFWKREKYIIFCEVFNKNAKEDLNYKDIKALNMLAQEYDNFTDFDIETMINNERLKEIIYD